MASLTDMGRSVSRGRRLIIAAYWTDEVEPFMQWEDGKRRFPDSIKGSGSAVSMTPEQVEQPGLRDVLRRLQLEEAADWGLDA